MKKLYGGVASFFYLSMKNEAGKIPRSRVSFYVFFVLCLVAASPANAQLLRTEGVNIVNDDDETVILRGMGLGGWMLQEGYMLQTNSFANPQHQIRAAIEGLIGAENTDEFYEAWLANHCTKADIDSLAAWGFNSVRLPMHYNLFTLPIEDEPVPGEQTWLEKGFEMTDQLLQWCAENELYLILDLHAAPGGQGNDAAISDYDSSKPSLWESDANKQKTVALWRKLAERYADEPWMGGYDLINEPNWNFTPGANQNGCEETSNAPLRQLYMDITAAIREVDQNHIIFIEGNCWANNHAGIWPPWDDNLVISFHKYWNYNDPGSIQGFINMRNQYGIPLWMGESGENSNTWFTNAIQLLEDNNIGWAWWPMKKVGSVVNPLTIQKNEGYDALLNYWENGGETPTTEFAKDALMQLAENLKIENNSYRKDVVDAMIRQPHGYATKPFAHHFVPGVVSASDFDLGRNGLAYYDADTANYRVSTNEYTAWNQGWVYRNDGVDIQASEDNSEKSNGYNIGWTADGEWMQYTLDVDSSAVYTVTVRYASPNNDGKIRLNIDGSPATQSLSLPATGGWQEWGNFSIENVALYKGSRKLQFFIETAGFNFGYLEFVISKKLSELPFFPLKGETNRDGDRIFITLNKEVDAASLEAATGFSYSVNGTAANVEAVEIDSESSRRMVLHTSSIAILDGDAVLVYYNGSQVKDTDGEELQHFSELVVANNLPFHFLIPAQIEAEDFYLNVGLQLEATSDTGGGQNIGYTNAGDYLEYYINVGESGEYDLEVRIACQSSAGILEFQQRSNDGEVLHSAQLDVPVTGGWQTWQTVSTKMELDEGRGILRVNIIQPEFNINWYRFAKPGIINSLNEAHQGRLIIYPNPAGEYLFLDVPSDDFSIDNSLSLWELNGRLVFHRYGLPSGELKRVNLNGLPSGLYLVMLSMNDKTWKNKLIVE